MEIVAINKHSSKLKDLSVEMPNTPYSNTLATSSAETQNHSVR